MPADFPLDQAIQPLRDVAKPPPQFPLGMNRAKADGFGLCHTKKVLQPREAVK
jgi:hypothetical protein